MNHDSMTKVLRRRVFQSKCGRRPSFRPRRGRNMAAQKHHTNERLLMLKQEFWAAACLSEASSAAQLKKRAGVVGGARARTPYKRFISKVWLLHAFVLNHDCSCFRSLRNSWVIRRRLSRECGLLKPTCRPKNTPPL